LSGVVLGSSVLGVWAEVKENPYEEIVNRNAFALKPPPPPPGPGENAPPPSPVDILLTGISTLGGTKKVLLQVTDKAPGKQKTEFPPPLVEGDVQGRVEVVSIDADKGAVVLKIDGNEKTLTFEKDSPKPGGAVPAGTPPHPMMPNPAGTIPLPGVTSAAGAAAAVNAAMAGGAAGTSGKYGVMVGGGTASVPSPATTVAGVGGVGVGTVPAAYGATTTPTIPTRPLRTDGSSGVTVGGSGGTTVAGQASTTPVLTREQILARRQLQMQSGAFPPMPPMPGAGGGISPPGMQPK
jgi:hypothetical protein